MTKLGTALRSYTLLDTGLWLYGSVPGVEPQHQFNNKPSQVVPNKEKLA